MSRWQVDPGVRDMVAYLDDPKRKYRWDVLSGKEVDAIRREIQRCRDSFEYAARNYFYITDKNRRDVNFSLWEAQELILDRIYELRRKGKPQKLMILKSRQLGCSTLIEALIAHRVLFFRNIEALVVSVDRSHAAYLFGIMLHILDRLPWWLQPMVAARKYEEGLWLANPDPELRRDFPGMNSRVVVQASNQISGIGQGRRLNACHISEGADWDQNIHRSTMEGDLQYALADNVETFAIWESTAKGAGTYTERLWLTNVNLDKNADWDPLFLPWFFEKTRVLAPGPGWRPEPPEIAMRERIKDDWVACSSPSCRRLFENHPVKGVTRKGSRCSACNSGVLEAYVLSDEQLCWMWRQRINKEGKGEDAVKELKAELCSTPQEAFQIHGLQVFGPECQEFVNSTIRSPVWAGDFDDRGRFHAVDTSTGRCLQAWCDMDHSWEEKPMEVWELPSSDARYVVGVDVSEGLGGRSDYSVAFVNKISDSGGADEQVAMYRSNTVDAVRFAYIAAWVGHWYNSAMLSIEYNGIGATCADTVRLRLLYPNLFRWLRPDNERPESSAWHWVTNYRTKPKLWQTARRYLRAKAWIIRSEQFYEEMLRFQKEDYDDNRASAESGWHDDVIMAAMIALYTSHVLDTDMEALRPAAHQARPLENDPEAWRMHCLKCQNKWLSPNPDVSCPRCRSLLTAGTRPGLESQAIPVDPENLEAPEIFEEVRYGSYEIG